MRSRHVAVSAVVYGALAWAVFVGVAAALLMWGNVVLPRAVSAALVVAGVMFIRESRASGEDTGAAWAFAVILWFAAVYVSGVLT